MRRFRKPPSRAQAKADPVTPALREAVLRRDGRCVAAILDRAHICRDAYGTPHDPRSLGKLSLEHVKDQLRMGVRAPSDEAHLVALCYGSNVGVPSKVLRAQLREYLAALPAHVLFTEHVHVDPQPGCMTCFEVFG